MRTFGLIPAAGHSRRMGQPKLLLPIDGQTVLDHVLSAVRRAGIADTLVVVGPTGDVVAGIATAAGAHVLQLEADTPDMRATCEMGLAWIEERFHPDRDDGWLLLPADHPTVRPRVISALLAMAQTSEDRSIFVPTFQGRKGHPAWLRWPLAAAVGDLPPGQGLNLLIRAHAAQMQELAWPSDEILRDLDTPADYERLLDGGRV